MLLRFFPSHLPPDNDGARGLGYQEREKHLCDHAEESPESASAPACSESTSLPKIEERDEMPTCPDKRHNRDEPRGCDDTCARLLIKALKDAQANRAPPIPMPAAARPEVPQPD